MKPKLQLIGTDAEFFLRNKDTNEIISAEGLVKGSKHKPFKFDKSEPHYSTQLDNVLAEITIPPRKTAAQFASAIDVALKYLKSTLPANIEIAIQASANLDKKWLMTEHAQMFGCDPDFNAYSGFINEKPFCEDVTLRSAGAHVHMGFSGVETKFNNDICNYIVDDQRSALVKAMDLFISVPLVLMEPDSERKRLYGKAGAFRPKPYGLEYRTPSSWYLSSKDTTKWAFNSAKQAFKYFTDNKTFPIGLPEHVQNVINNNDKLAAEALVKDFNLQLI